MRIGDNHRCRVRQVIQHTETVDKIHDNERGRTDQRREIRLRGVIIEMKDEDNES